MLSSTYKINFYPLLTKTHLTYIFGTASSINFPVPDTRNGKALLDHLVLLTVRQMICSVVTASGVFSSPACKIWQQDGHLPLDCTFFFTFIFAFVFSVSFLKSPFFFLAELLGFPLSMSSLPSPHRRPSPSIQLPMTVSSSDFTSINTFLKQRLEGCKWHL